jgi:flagellar M-ring protein FliF
VRSTQSVTEQSEAKDSKANDNVSVNNNLPNLPQPQGAGNASASKNNRNEETTNYEIGKTVKNHLRESGQVRRLSVAVLVDGTYTPGQDGKTEYKPRSDAELQQIRALVRSATGFDQNRGDVLEIANMRFMQEETPFGEPADTSIMGFAQTDLLRVAQTAIVAIVGLLVLLLVVRPLLSRAIAAAPAGAKPNGDNLLADQSVAVPALTGPGGSALAGELARREAQEDEDFEQMIDMSKVEGRVRASSVRKIGELIDKHPAEAANLLRTWMYQEP